MNFRNSLLVSCVVLVCASGARMLRAQSAVRDGQFRTSDGVTLHYLEAGAGPTLVFVPGWTMPADIWDAQLRHFAATHHVVALDPRGQGRSEKPAFGYQPSRRARDIAELVAHLGGEPVVLIGWSLAAQEVLVLTHEVGTTSTRAVVLVDHPTYLEDAAAAFTSRFVSLQVEREAWTRRFIAAIHRSPQPDEYLERMTRAALSTPTNAAAMMIANLILMGPTDLRSMVDDLDRPALFVYSSLGWAMVAAEEVRRRWPAMPVEVVDETSHALFVDKPTEFNQVLEAFLESLAQ